MDFVKMHGTGNDFVVLAPGSNEFDWPALARAICDRHFGVGADGLIVGLASNRCDLRLRMFNPDGSEAEMCGNGIRCLAKFAIESGLASAHDHAISVETLAGDLRCELGIRDGAVEWVRVAMGRPRFAPAEVPVLAQGPGPLRDFPVQVDGQEFAVTCVSMGNPHAVHFTQTPVDGFALASIGPKVEHHAAFPRRVNFEIVNLVERGHVRTRVWERGAGETLACGTGACAVGVASVLAGMSDGRTIVSLPGGDLEIEWDRDGDVYLTGPATEVFRGDWLQGAQPLAAVAGSEGARA